MVDEFATAHYKQFTNPNNIAKYINLLKSAQLLEKSKSYFTIFKKALLLKQSVKLEKEIEDFINKDCKKGRFRLYIR